MRSEPFLWIHLSGIVLFPFFLEIAWVGLSVGNSWAYWLEIPLLAIATIVPVLLMQLNRPFDIFSVLLLSLAPENLSEERQKILALFKTAKIKFFSILAAIAMVLVLWLIYLLSPLATGAASWLPQWRILGLAIAALALWGSNLFLQIPLSALLVLLTEESQMAQAEPYLPENIAQDFTIPGFKVASIFGLN